MSAPDPIRIGYEPGKDVTLDHLQDQLEWYDRKSTLNQRRFKQLKLIAIVAAAAGPYAAANDRHALLAERIESLVSQEHAKWASTQEQHKDKASDTSATATAKGA